TKAKLCREFPDTRNPSRRALPFSLALSLFSSLSLSRATLSLSSPSHALSLLAGAVWWWGDRISISSPLSLVSRPGSRSRLRTVSRSIWMWV
uniref:Uncharacterized protein n=1 Tax=Brassica oleracea var. oleracea TaxID=109376 RepID=A0A0D3AMU1_BRAOL